MTTTHQTHLYRVVRRVNMACSPGERVSYQVHEVYFKPNGGIERITTSPVTPLGHTRASLRQNMWEFQKTLDRAVIDYLTLTEIPWSKVQELDDYVNAR